VSSGFSSIARLRPSSLTGIAPTIVLLAATILIGPHVGSLIRPAFIVGCAAAGWYAWRVSPAVHVQAALWLFSFAPFARRIVDLSIGYDQSGLMLVGPLMAILAPFPRLLTYFDDRKAPSPVLLSMMVFAGCVAYAATISLFQGDWFNAASGALKWTAPVIYAAVLLRDADRDEMVQGMASAFLIILPITGVAGILQYINPPEWDRYWMQFSPILSIGRPLPYEIRVFSTMNGPASFATFTATGLLLVCFLRSRWYTAILAMPAALALLLSLYRTAWLALAAGLMFCFLFDATRKRAALIGFGALGAIVFAAVLPPFSEVVTDRLATLTEGSTDGSAQERLEQYMMLWSQWDSSLFGVGFTTADVGSAGAIATDGTIIQCWLAMGIVVGLVCLIALVWATASMMVAAWRDGRREAIVVGAIGCGMLVQLPLATITSGELGFLFWTFAALAALGPSAARAMAR
jgi:hypothetical protein